MTRAARGRTGPAPNPFLRQALVLTALAAISAYVAGGREHVPWLGAFVAAAGLSSLVARRLPSPGILAQGITLAALGGWFFLECGATGEPLPALLHTLVLFLGLVAPWADAPGLRWTFASGAGTLVICAAVFPTTGMILVALALLLLFASHALGVAHLSRTAAAWDTAGAGGAAARLRSRLGALRPLAIAANLALFAATLGTLVFLLAPRSVPGAGGRERTDGRGRPGTGGSAGRRGGAPVLTGAGGGRTGFRDRVDFADIGPIKMDHRVALHVRLRRGGRPAAAPGGVLLLRGTALNRYANGAWTAAGVGTKRIADKDDGEEDGRVSVSRAPAGSAARILEQQVESVSLGLAYYFHVARLTRVRAPGAVVDGNDAAVPEGAIGSGYTVWSDPVARGPEWRGAAVPASLPAFLEVPGGEARKSALASRAKTIAGGALPEEPYARAEALERGLKKSYAATLRVRRPPARQDPVEAFLDRKIPAGHCEFFASALALLLRSAGIPSRLVSGFRSPEGDPAEAGAYIVRHSHAHAWVEAAFRLPDGTVAWVPFDATPADPAPGTPLPPLPRLAPPGTDGADDLLASLGDALRDYGPEDRAAVVAAIGAGARTAGPPLGAAMLAAALVLGLLAARRARSGAGGRGTSGASGPRTAPPRPVPFYRALLQALTRSGFRRAAGRTPREFAAEVVAAGGPPYGGVEAVTALFERVRYGGAPLTREEEAEARRMIRGLPARTGGDGR